MVLDLQLKKGTRLKALNLSKLSSVRGTFRPSPCTILLQLLVRCQRPLACARLDVSYNTEPSFTAIDDGFHCVVSGRLALRGSAGTTIFQWEVLSESSMDLTLLSCVLPWI